MLKMKTKREDYVIILNQQKLFLEKSCDDFDKGDEFEAIRLAGHLRTILHDSKIKKDYDASPINALIEIKEIISSENFNQKKTVLNKINGVISKLKKKQKPQTLSRSLITQINKKNSIKFIDTSLPKGSNSFYTFANSISNTTVIPKSYFGLLAKDVFKKNNKQYVRYYPLCKHQDFNSYIQNCTIIDFEQWWNKEIFNSGNGVSFSRKDLVLYVANHDGYAHVEENIDLNYKLFKEANILDNFINSYSKDKVNLATLNSIRQIAYEVTCALNDLQIFD